MTQNQLSYSGFTFTRKLIESYLSIACIFVRIKVFSFSRYPGVHIGFFVSRKGLRNIFHVTTLPIVTKGGEGGVSGGVVPRPFMF